MQKINARLSQRIAQESQLLAEEKWIIDALKKVKQQRNSLQIERFHLDNLRRSMLYDGVIKPVSTESPSVTSEATDLCPPPSEATQKEVVPEENKIVTSLSQFDVPVVGIDDEMINTEQLNLSVTNSVFTKQQFNGFDMEEDEEDLDNGLEEDDMEIEMNMLMNSKPCS